MDSKSNLEIVRAWLGKVRPQISYTDYDMEDLIQDLSLIALECKDKQVENYNAYCWGAFFHKLYNVRRKYGRQRSQLEDEHILIEDEEYIGLREALLELSVDEQKIIELYYFQGLTLNEISAQLLFCSSHIYNTKRRALHKLRQLV